MNCTPVMRFVFSDLVSVADAVADAVAVMVVVPESVAPDLGAVRETLGAVGLVEEPPLSPLVVAAVA